MALSIAFAVVAILMLGATLFMYLEGRNPFISFVILLFFAFLAAETFPNSDQECINPGAASVKPIVREFNSNVFLYNCKDSPAPTKLVIYYKVDTTWVKVNEIIYDPKK